MLWLNTRLRRALHRLLSRKSLNNAVSKLLSSNPGLFIHVLDLLTRKKVANLTCLWYSRGILKFTFRPSLVLLYETWLKFLWWARKIWAQSSFLLEYRNHMCELVKWLSDSMWAKSLARTLLAFRLERERFHEIKAWPTIYRIPPSLHKYYIRRSKLKARGSPPPNTIVLFSGLDPWFSNEKGPLVSRQCSRSLFRTPLATEHGTEMDQYSVVKWGPFSAQAHLLWQKAELAELCDRKFHAQPVPKRGTEMKEGHLSFYKSVYFPAILFAIWKGKLKGKSRQRESWKMDVPVENKPQPKKIEVKHEMICCGHIWGASASCPNVQKHYIFCRDQIPERLGRWHHFMW